MLASGWELRVEPRRLTRSWTDSAVQARRLSLLLPDSLRHACLRYGLKGLLGQLCSDGTIVAVDGDEAEQKVLGNVDAVAAVSRAKITFDVPGCEELPDKSRIALEQITANYARRVFEEAGRLEAAASQGVTEPMITPTHLTHADTWLSQGYAVSSGRQGKSIRAKIYTGISYIIAIICGFFVNNIDKPWGSIGVSVLLIAGATTFFLGEVKSD